MRRSSRPRCSRLCSSAGCGKGQVCSWLLRPPPWWLRSCRRQQVQQMDVYKVLIGFQTLLMDVYMALNGFQI